MSSIIEGLFALWQSVDQPLLTIFLACSLLATAMAIVGSIVVVDRMALSADVVTNAALPGVLVAFVVSAMLGEIGAEGQTSLALLLLLAGFTSFLSLLMINYLTKPSSSALIDHNAAIAVSLCAFLGVGLIVSSVIQILPLPSMTFSKDLIKGSAAALTLDEAAIIAMIVVIQLGMVMALFRPIRAMVFHPTLSTLLGLPHRLVRVMILAMLTVDLVLGLVLVGPILAVGLMIIPVCACVSWTKRLSSLIMGSIIVGIISTTLGILSSTQLPSLGVGPAIVFYQVIIVALSIGGVLFRQRYISHADAQRRVS